MGSKVFDRASFAEVARTLNISKGKAYHQYHKALNKLDLYIASYHKDINRAYGSNCINNINTRLVKVLSFVINSKADNYYELFSNENGNYAVIYNEQPTFIINQ